MPYSIPFTDETNNGSIVVIDNTLNEQTSLKLPGQNYSGYGTAIAENFLHLLENFSSATEPERPTEGQLWYDTTPGVEQLKVYDGTSWVPSGGLNKAGSEPEVSASQTGDLWADTENQQLYLNSGAGWILVGPSFSDGLATGASPQTVIGTDNEEYTVLLIEVGARPVAVISSNEFTPKTVIPGFTTLQPGVNLSNRNITGSGIPKFVGTSERAEGLIVNNETVEASNFLRGDTASTTLFPMNVQNNTGLLIGTDAALSLGIEGQAGIISHQIEGSNIDVRVKSGGVSNTVLRIDSSQRLGINNQSPDEALDVIGNIQTNASVIINGTDQSNNKATGSITTKGGVGIAKNLNVGGNSTFANLSTFANIEPDGNNTRNFGSPEAKWQNVYATTFVGNLTGNVSGTVSGIAGSANKLTSPTTFRITGDLTSQDVIFDGTTGGTTKEFAAELNNSVIADKEEIFDSNADDEIILNRTQGATGLYKISRQNFLKIVPENPVGVIMPFGGDSAPPGWLLCDGKEYDRGEFNDLFKVVRYKFGAQSTVGDNKFRVPDLRGRLPLGADNMGGTSANVVTGSYADGVGQTGGSEANQIDITNLPEHKHDLRGEDGQFYAIRRSAEPATAPADDFNAPSQLDQAQALPNSGNVLADEDIEEPFNVMNPTLTLNYIIYTGRN